MRCQACGRENDTDRPFCAGCAAELVPGSASLVEPPRARGRTRRQFRRAESWIAREFGGLFVAAERARPSSAAAARLGRRLLLLAASLLPGLPRLLLGESRAGWVMLLAFAGATLAWALLMGTAVATLMAMVAVSLLLSSATDAVRIDVATGRRRPFRVDCALMGLGLVGGAYALATLALSAGWERVTVAMPVVRVAASGSGADVGRDPTVFDRGDRLLFSRRAYRNADPMRGDVILTSREGMLYVDRVIAVPGDVLKYQEGRLYLNESPLEPDAYPIQPAQAFQVQGAQVHISDWTGNVREGEYLVWGIHYPDEMGVQHGQIGMGPVSIRKSEILGRAWLVYCPFQHRRIVNHADPAPGG